MATSALLIISGLLCLFLVVVAFLKLRPQEGQPPSPWVGTDFRGTAVAMTILVVFLTGVSLVIKGIVA